jgi:antitoxin VapB
MSLSIQSDRVEWLAREVARESGTDVGEAIVQALQERLARLRARPQGDELLAEVLAISSRCAALPDLDRRPPDEILGYGEAGTSEPCRSSASTWP